MLLRCGVVRLTDRLSDQFLLSLMLCSSSAAVNLMKTFVHCGAGLNRNATDLRARLLRLLSSSIA